MYVGGGDTSPLSKGYEVATPEKTARYSGFTEAVDMVMSGEHEAEGFSLMDWAYDNLKHVPDTPEDQAWAAEWLDGYRAGVRSVT